MNQALRRVLNAIRFNFTVTVQKIEKICFLILEKMVDFNMAVKIVVGDNGNFIQK